MKKKTIQTQTGVGFLDIHVSLNNFKASNAKARNRSIVRRRSMARMGMRYEGSMGSFIVSSILESVIFVAGVGLG